MTDSIITKMFIVMLFAVFSFFFWSSNARSTQWELDSLNNIHVPLESSKRTVPGGPNPLHNNEVQIDKKTLGGPDHIHNLITGRTAPIHDPFE